ncbi:hypothetical protein HY501_01340 [Candidatus Woesearchaeota archaeon]|nr:hypothetical protein [Candidatus Woesearchaeota archaeon]
MKKPIFLFLFFLLGIPAVSAHCPLCTAAVGAATITAQYYGLDASIIGLLVGAFAISTGLWIALKLRRRYVPFQLPLIASASFFLTVIPLLPVVNSGLLPIPALFTGDSGGLLNRVYWIDRFLLGSVIGGLATIGGFALHRKIKSVNQGVLFPFQGVAITLLLLLVSGTALFWGLN